MKPMNLDLVVRNIDRRLERVEQILPTLPTRDEMHAALNAAIRDAVAPLATREDLEEKIAPLVTRDLLEQKIAPLATRDLLEQTIAPLVTRDLLEQKIAPLATRDLLEQKIAPLVTRDLLEQKIAPLATRDLLEEKIAPLATKDELREEFERSRRHTEVLFESLRDDIHLVAEGIAATQTELKQIVHPRLDNHGRRITALEDARGLARD